ncbi:MAG: hypothetical protein RR745_06245 [Bacilli bacterium]
MKIKISSIEGYLSFIIFFLVGFYKFNYAIVFSILLLIFLSRKLNNNVIFYNSNIPYLIVLYIGIFLFYIISFIHGMYDNYNNMGEILAVVIFIFLGYLFINLLEINKKHLVLAGLLFGLGSYSSYCLWYTYFELGQVSAYSKVWNPFLESYENSPSHAINIALLSAWCINSIFKRRFIEKLFFIPLVIFLILAGLYSGSRVFLLIVLFSIVFNIVESKKIIFPILLIIVFITIFPFLDFSDFTTFDRLSSDGLKSQRFELYYLGLENLFYYPFGGYQVDKSTFGTVWLHNIFLDVSRMAGLIPLVLFLIFYIGVIKRILKYKKNIDKNLILIFLSSFVLMQQDVIFTGNFMLFICSIFSCFTILFYTSEKRIFH